MKKQSVESSGSSEEFNISDIIEDDDNIEPKIESESDMDDEYKTITSISKKKKENFNAKKEEPSKKNRYTHLDIKFLETKYPQLIEIAKKTKQNQYTLYNNTQTQIPIVEKKNN